MIFPNYTVGVSGACVVGHQLLLVRTEYAGIKWQFPGGYVEDNESLNDTLHREIHEELGIECEIGELVGIYLKEYEQNINFLYTIQLDLDQITVDGDEVKEAKLFSLDTLPSNASHRTKRMAADVFSTDSVLLTTFRTKYDEGNR